MAVVNNTCSAIGDVLFIETQANVLGNIIQLTSYTDTVVGETSTRYFDRQFRVSTNGFLWTSWSPLTNTNLQAISGQVNGILYFQFAYTRAGTDTTGVLEFIDIIINGQILPFECKSVSTHLSIFNNYACGSIVTAEICNNLLKKLYKSGIIPEYMIRGEGETADEDYLAFWGTIACYFAMVISYMTQFDNLMMNRQHMIQYLKQKGLYLCQDDVSLQDLQWLSEHFYDEIRKRGTIQVFKKRGEVLADGSVVPIDGEFLRLICYHHPCDEFLVELTKTWRLGWNIGNSSPMYKGTLFEEQLIKGYEKEQDVQDIAKYLMFGSSYSIVLDTDNYGNPINVLEFNQIPLSTSAGFGSTNLLTLTNYDYSINVHPSIDYEITFWVKSEDAKILSTLSAIGLDENNNKYLLDKIDGSGVSMNFFTNEAFNGQTNFYYFVRAIIYRYGHQNIYTQEKLLNINWGRHLRFTSNSICKIVPALYFTNTNNFLSGKIKVWDFKIRPLRTNYSLGFLNTAEILQIWAKKNNAEFTFDQVELITKKYLIPYRTVPVWTWLVNKKEGSLSVIK